jgi:Na+-transporting methylmalonyl-CoA/oxaloacetate decarboxylase gamma subunit
VLDFVTFVFSFLTLLTYVVAKFWEGLRSWTGKKDRKTQKSDNRAKTAVRRRLPVVRKKNLKP